MDFLQAVQQTLAEKQAEDIVCLDVTKRFPLADFFIIAQGKSTRHLISLCDYLIDLARAWNVPYSLHGREEGTSWVVVDLSTIFVHIFSPERRKVYNLEGLWGGEDPINPEPPSGLE